MGESSMNTFNKMFCVPTCLLLFACPLLGKKTPAQRAYLFGQATFAGPVSPASIASGDFNRDGKLDFVLSDPQHNSVSVLLGEPDGTFLPAASFSTGANPRFVAVGDFNSDGKLDLAVTFGSGVSILLGNGNGSFQSHADIPLSDFPAAIKSGDFNGDTDDDLAVITQDSGGTGA